MVKNIGDLVPDKRKQNQGRPAKSKILRQAKVLQEKWETLVGKE